MQARADSSIRGATESLRLYLRHNKLRLTRERLELLRAALARKRHFDAEDLLADLARRRPAVSRATAYRTLALLERCGILRRSLVAQGRSRYEPAMDRAHHDHFVCVACGKIVEFHDAELETILERIAARRGFHIQEHVHELYGTCRTCRSGRSTRSGANGRKGRNKVA